MNMGQSQRRMNAGLDTAIWALVGQEGTISRSYVRGPGMSDSRTAGRNLADAVHYLCVLHGRHPGVVDIAAQMTTDPIVQGWMAQVIKAFADERRYMNKLAVAVGPQPSTPGQAESVATVNSQRHALEILSRSDRDGCALGAAIALVLDWVAVRNVLDRAATRLGMAPISLGLPLEGETLAVAAHYATTPGIERAILFGAQQLVAQHRGLWNLLEARHLSRVDY